MKLLIIEDEPLMRQALMKIIERFGLPIECMEQAGDGLEGLRKLADGKPDIIITDIRMPEMDGLDFIQEAKKVDAKLQFIIISGYDEFEYAKRGIQFGVVDYLLKPVNHEELRNSLLRIMAKIEEERRLTSINEEYRQLRMQSDEVMRERLWTKLIQQGGDSAEIENNDTLRALQASCQQFVIVLFEVVIPVLPYRSFLKGDESLLRFALSNMISQVMDSSNRKGMIFHHSIYDKELVYVMGADQAMEVTQFKQELEEAKDGINRYLKLDVTVAAGTPVKHIRDIHQSYQQAKQSLRDKIIHGPNKVYLPAQADGPGGNRSSIITDEDELFLIRQLDERKADSIDRWLSQRIRDIVRAEDCSFNQLESFCVDLHILYRKYLYTQTSVPEWIIGEIDDLLTWLHAVEDWNQIEERLCGVGRTIIEHLNKVHSSTDFNIMEEVKHYIKANLHEPLSLQMIADRFFIHPNYFSRRFKEKFKESFVSYMTGERIRKAEQLLKETELQIQEIAMLVGYSDAAYFSSVFRKSTGTTPIQYRMNSITGVHAADD